MPGVWLWVPQGLDATCGIRIVYDSTTGVLTYDANGSAHGGAVPFAILDPGLALTNTDFWAS